MDESLHPSCQLCSNQSQDKRIVLAKLMRLLQRQLNLFNKKDGLVGNQEGRQGFKQILKVLNLSEKTSISGQCRHMYLQKFLMKKLGCPIQILNFICHKVALHIAQKNYQIELVRQQIKNVSQSIDEGKISFSFNDAAITHSSAQDKAEKQLGPLNDHTKKAEDVKLQNSINDTSPQPNQNLKRAEIIQSNNPVLLIPNIHQEPNVKIEPAAQRMQFSYFVPIFPYFYSRNE